MESSKGNAVIMLIFGLILVILIIGGLYIYMNQGGKFSLPGGKPSVPAQTQNKPIYEQSTSEENLEGNLDAVNVLGAEADAEFDALDRDLQSL